MPKDDKTAARRPAGKSAGKARKKAAGRSSPVRRRSPQAKPKKAGKAKPARKPARKAKFRIDDPKARAELKERNLALFKQYAPRLYERLVDFEPKSALEVEDGQPDVVFQGQYFYNHEYTNYVKKQLRGFWREPLRLLLAPLQPHHYDETAGKFLFNVLKRSTKRKLNFHLRPTAPNSYYLFVLGIGLAGHVMELVRKTQCKAVFITDPNPEFAYHSLEVYDWSELFETMKKRKGRIDFLIESDADRLSIHLRAWLRGTNPMSVDGATYFYHYRNPVFTKAIRTLNKEAELILTGLGFFYDETLMLRNTHHNLFSGNERAYMRPKGTYMDVPAFVVGNGPSLDKDIPYIRENKEKAVIISSGSALRPLLVNGITPDFHMETENVEVYPLISQVAKTYDLSPIRLVTSTTVDPKAIPYFDKVLYYFRGSLSPYPIFCDTFDRCLIHPNPTVVNASLSLMQEAGFRQIYLFGADMGVKVGELHHSKDAYHYTKGARFRHDTYNIPVPANFGGKSMTSKGLFWTLDTLGLAINHFKIGRIYYNCSDGALIKGTIPKPARSISLSTDSKKKRQAVEKTVGFFPVYSREEFDAHWNDETIIEYMTGYLDDFGAVLDKRKSYDNKDYLTDLMKMLSPPSITDRALVGPAVTFRGTLFMMMIGFEYYRSRLRNKTQAPPYDAIARKEFKGVLKYLRKTAIKEFGTLTRDAVRAAAKAKKTAKKGPAAGRRKQKRKRAAR